jgi:hypothetical protein
MVRLLSSLRLHVGLVTNGTQLHRIRDETYKEIDWVRISFGDQRELTKDFKSTVASAVVRSRAVGANVGWAFSYVLSANPRYDLLKDIVEFANGYRFTHVRVVSDLLDLNNTPSMDKTRSVLRSLFVDDGLVIYQGRKDFTPGRSRCLISLLKPVVGADGGIYPCCGAQYAMDPPGLDYEKRMFMAPAADIIRLYENQAHFDGIACVRCYYDSYNVLLAQMLNKLEHEEFV